MLRKYEDGTDSNDVVLMIRKYNKHTHIYETYVIFYTFLYTPTYYILIHVIHIYCVWSSFYLTSRFFIFLFRYFVRNRKEEMMICWARAKKYWKETFRKNYWENLNTKKRVFDMQTENKLGEYVRWYSEIT